MPLSVSAKSEIRAELSELHRLKVAVDERVKALEAVLSPFDFSQDNLFPGVGKTTTVIDGEHTQAAIESAVGEPRRMRDLFPNGIIQGVGLRSAILAVLKERGPSKATDVTRILTERKFPTEGAKTPLNTRVYNDLYRMAQLEQIKMENGLFRVKE